MQKYFPFRKCWANYSDFWVKIILAFPFGGDITQGVHGLKWALTSLLLSSFSKCQCWIFPNSSKFALSRCTYITYQHSKWLESQRYEIGIIIRLCQLFLGRALCFFQRSGWHRNWDLLYLSRPLPNLTGGRKNMTKSRIKGRVQKNLQKSSPIFLGNLTNRRHTKFYTSLGPSVALFLFSPNKGHIDQKKNL